MIKIGKILLLFGVLIDICFFWAMLSPIIFSLTFFIVLGSIAFVSFLAGFVLILKKAGEAERKKTKFIALILGLLLLLCSLLFRYLHLPMRAVFLATGIIILMFFYTPLQFREKFAKWKQFTRSKRDALVLSLLDFLTIVIVLLGIMFKMQHWAGASVAIYIGALLIAVSLLAWNQKFKKEVVYRKMAEDRLSETLEEVRSQKKEIEDKNEELNQQNEEIASQRDQLDKQHQAIKDSISYAKRIQQAVLPRQNYIDELLPESFILFRPRDIVSGDFYFIKQVNRKVIVTAVDCTGHGVPGSIMSMLGMSFINETVQRREITQANLILNELRQDIKQALRQTSDKDEVFDGMDMALCVIDMDTKKIQYAGANNPLYLIQNNELNIIKADRMPIGYYPKEKPEFTNHEIQLNAGDTFYLFSDGYMDQFGGKNGFRYKAANFQKKLLEIHTNPMKVQMQLLEEELKTWMNSFEQTDDILVMGVRV